MNIRMRIAAILLGLAVLVLAPGTAAAEDDFTFAVVGDMPYNRAQEITIQTVLAPALKESGLPFLIHVGDFKAGDQSCSDELIAKRHDQIYGLLPDRVFYTPGDNEWTDCDRKWLANRKQELERLDHLRNVFYPAPLKLGDNWEITTQEEENFPENARWWTPDTADGLVFATIHLVSTNNGRDEIFPLNGAGEPLPEDEREGYVKKALERVDDRDAANAQWLEDTFKLATKIGARAVVVATQADVTTREDFPPCADDTKSIFQRTVCDAFADARAKITELAAAFGKPVLLIHGDTNPFCLDKKFGGKRAPKLWRLNALGDFADADATLVTVGGPGAWQAFTVNRLMTGGFLDRDADCK